MVIIVWSTNINFLMVQIDVICQYFASDALLPYLFSTGCPAKRNTRKVYNFDNYPFFPRMTFLGKIIEVYLD